MIHENSLSTFRKYVAAAFKAGTQTFPHYTLHGLEHLEELDRLARMLCDAIPKLNAEPDRFNLLRLALIMHDFAMVDVPDPAREAELREQMGHDISFADIVRKTHQDEVEQSLTKPGRIEFLTSTFSDSDPHELDDALTVAKHHRFHPLNQAPDHLQDLCALMRLIDELDIGPKRAPRPAYEAMRPRMDHVSKFHWLKHICTRAIERDPTFSVEEKNGRRVLRIWIAVKATKSSWEKLQLAVQSKIQECLEKEGVQAIIKDRLGVEFQVDNALGHLCGETGFLPGFVRDDLEAFVSSTETAKTPLVAVSDALGISMAAIPEVRRPDFAIRDLAFPSFSREEEFPIIAIPPENLPETLCRSGRLTVIGNQYVTPNEKHLGGVVGASSRFYVGPADCGKTRAASEWIAAVTADRTNRWVVLRTDIGSVPSDVKNIRLDTSQYAERGLQLPQRAILFLDDLPANLPPPGATLSPTDAVRRLFEWFESQPYFQERRVVGTIRAEDMHARPDWPDVLPSLGQELELLSVSLDSPEQYRALWQGLASGLIYPSVTGEKPFSITIEEAFIDEVLERPANPEAIAVFVVQSAMKDVERIGVGDAERYSTSAVETWLKETWPVMHKAYGKPARVFFTLARFLAAGLRPESGYKMSLPPAWGYHAALGPDLCETVGCPGTDYLAVLEKILRDGHAVGEKNEWIKPKWDFLLQAESLSGVDVETPPPDWFAERSLRLTMEKRRSLAAHFAWAGRTVVNMPHEDFGWHFGWGGATGLRADDETDPAKKYILRCEASRMLEVAASVNPRDPQLPKILAEYVRCEAAVETDDTRRIQLCERVVKHAHKALEIDTNDSDAQFILAAALGMMADAETDASRVAELRQQELAAYRSAVEADPKNDGAWLSLGVRLGQQADRETDASRVAELRQQEIAAYRGAVEANPKNDWTWTNLGFRLGQQAAGETDATRVAELRQQELVAYRSEVDANPKNDGAWNRLSAVLITFWRISQDDRSLNDALDAAKNAAELGGGRYNVACALAVCGQAEQAFEELSGCLARNEITRGHVKADPDWDTFRDHPTYQRLVQE